MKKSEMYKKAQIAILQMEGITFNETLEILKELMEAESLAKFQEKEEEKCRNEK